jgi:pSer/pThr/pTyr-binding forkhead associated (FHA) protein
MIAVALCAAALLYHTQMWPQRWHIPVNVPSRVTSIIAAVAGCLALIWLTTAIVNVRRWHLGRAIERLSEDPALAKCLPDTQISQASPRALLIPVLAVDDRSPRKTPRAPQLWRVTATHNVVGKRPLSIVYLRMFENQPRTRTFIQGAWREFGYVYFLRSAKSVTPSEFRRTREPQNVAGLFIASPEQFAAELARPPAGPSGGYRHTFKNVGSQTIRVWDRYGSYPPRALLCHGAVWKAAVDMLLDRADLVVFDLSGFMPDNLGVGYELQRVVDRIPIERVIFLADQRSDRTFLRTQVLRAWEQMAAGSPNSGAQPRVARIAVTDVYRQIQYQQVQAQGQPQTTYVQVRLIARRSQSRRLAAAAPVAPQRMPRTPPESPAVPGIKPIPEATADRIGEPTLVVMSGPNRGRRIPVPPGGLALGRDHRLGPPFTTDKFVSRKHASVNRRGDGSIEVIDHGSANGTYVNGKHVTAPTQMNASDVLRVGQTELRLDVTRSAALPGDDTAVVTSGKRDAAAAQPGQGTDDHASPPNVLFLKQARPPSSRVWPLTGDRLTIGRDASCDIVVIDSIASRHHADLVRQGRNWSIIDADSTNGTSVNGAGVHQLTLQPGDRIEIGEVELILTPGP